MNELQQIHESSLRVAAHLADPLRGLGDLPAAESINLGEVLTILRENKVTLACFRICPQAHNLPWLDAVLAASEMQDAIESEYRWYVSLRTAYMQVNERLLDAGIQPILIKTTDVFPYKSDNIDILVAPEVYEQAGSILIEMDFVELAHWEDEPDKLIFRRFLTGHEPVTIHLHRRVHWDGPSVVDERELRRRAMTSPADDSIRIPSSADSLLIVLAHDFYENRSINLLDLRRAADCLRKPQLDWDYILTTASVKRWLSGFYTSLLLFSNVEGAAYGETLFPEVILKEAYAGLRSTRRIFPFPALSVNQTSLSMPHRFSKLATKPYTYARILRGPTGFSWHKLQYVGYDIIHASLGLIGIKTRLRQSSMLVALSGMDGSGKTAHATAMAAALENCDVKTRRVWMRPRYSHTTEAVKGLLRKLLPSRVPGVTDESGKQKLLSSPMGSRLWTAFTVAHTLWQYLADVRLPLWLHTVVICDRYAVDTVVDLSMAIGDPGFAQSSLGRLLLRLAPKPDLAIFLDVSPAVGCQRCVGKEDVATQERVRDLYLDLQGTQFEVVDTTGAFEDVSSSLIRWTMLRYFDRFSDHSIEVKRHAVFERSSGH